MEILRKTKSVCPVCLKNISADLLRFGDEIILSKLCEEHGKFEAVVWRGGPDFSTWGTSETQNQKKLQELKRTGNNEKTEKQGEYYKHDEHDKHDSCPHDCGLCPQHEQRTCTVLLELTQACNLHCPVCFADAVDIKKISDFISADKVFEQLIWIREKAGSVVLQLSGGEPTVYPHLLEVVQAASKLFPAVQLNTNGLLLAEDEHLAKKLKSAGLAWVFLQCDGDTDAIHTQLRGRPLQETKIKAIENCKKAGLSVVLVPVIVAGVNDDKLGDILRFGLSFFPTVRGVHFQPMTLSGRNSFNKAMSHVTLPEVITKLSEQTNNMIKVEHAFPSSCEHVLCSFHCRYYVDTDGQLQYIRGDNTCACDTTDFDGSDDAPERTIASVIRSWKGDSDAPLSTHNDIGKDGKKENHEVKKELLNGMDKIDELNKFDRINESDRINEPNGLDAFDAFIARAKKQTFSVTCMAFQDVHTLDLERLQKCCIHIYDPQNKLIPFCAYNLTSLDGVSLYRS